MYKGVPKIVRLSAAFRVRRGSSDLLFLTPLVGGNPTLGGYAGRHCKSLITLDNLSDNR